MSPAREKHFTASELVRDLIIGMSDGLTVPFALAAGITGAVQSSSIVVTAGVAEIAAGSIAMGLGGYLSAKSEAEHYAIERAREAREVMETPLLEEEEVFQVFHAYGLSRDESRPVVEALKANPHAWIDFMMRFELGLEQPESRRAISSAITIALAYVLGGLIPLSPYFFAKETETALLFSVVFTLTALGLFGALKGKITGGSAFRSGLEMVLTGGLAASAAFLLARLVA